MVFKGGPFSRANNGVVWNRTFLRH